VRERERERVSPKSKRSANWACRVRVSGTINGRSMVKFINGLGFKPGKKLSPRQPSK
jgi:hypothetical protein